LKTNIFINKIIIIIINIKHKINKKSIILIPNKNRNKS
jgi:hypothetical protein